MGWDGTEVTPQIKHLIEDHHLGSIILTAKNLKCQYQRLYPTVGYLLTHLLQPLSKLLDLYKSCRPSPSSQAILSPFSSL